MSEPSMTSKEKKGLAKSIIGKSEKGGDLERETRGGDLRHIRIEPANNGFTVHHSIEHKGKGDSDLGISGNEEHHVFNDKDATLKHVGGLMDKYC